MKIIDRKLVIFLLLILSLGTNYAKFAQNNLLSEEEVITTITSDNESALRDAFLVLSKIGGIIYIDTPEINISEQNVLSINGNYPGGVVGLEQPNGEYPRLNFKIQRETVTYVYMAGITISASNKILKNLIIENAGTAGIHVNGQKNTFENIITRYNGHSGIYISPISDSNVFNYCYSYRNFHFPENKLTADGFTVEMGGINNVFNYCYAWDNSHNGFGYYYFNGKEKIGSLTYSHSASWNNGNLDVFSGKYDYDNRNPLDKNLWTIQEIIKSDENFEDNYNNRKFNLDNAKISSKPAIEYFSQFSKGDDGCGFNFGIEKNEQSEENKRIVDYCVTFDHKSKGFNSNNSQDFLTSFTNCVGFNNNMNYDLAYAFTKWSNNWGWGSKESDHFDFDVTLKTPKDTSFEEKKFYRVRDKIIEAVNSNTFPVDINFNKSIKGLIE